MTIDLALEDGLSIRSSGRPLRVVVRNLLHNACKFAEAGGCVRIHTRLGEQGQVVLQIFNDGEPIPAAINDAGTAETCVDPTEPERRGGTRLGLGLSFNISARQGWNLRLQPARATEGLPGTEVRLTLDGGFIRGA